MDGRLFKKMNNLSFARNKMKLLNIKAKITFDEIRGIFNIFTIDFFPVVRVERHIGRRYFMHDKNNPETKTLETRNRTIIEFNDNLHKVVFHEYRFDGFVLELEHE